MFSTCTRPTQKIPIEETIVHPMYHKPKRRMNDIALIRLAKGADIDFDVLDVLPICLPITEKLDFLPTQKFIVTGWGLTETGTRSRVLLQAGVPFFDKEKCEKLYKAELGEGQFCSGGEKNIDNCQGDSGGSLQYPGFLDKYDGLRMLQYGIVSFGSKDCGTENFPGVYTKVHHYIDWILSNLKE